MLNPSQPQAASVFIVDDDPGIRVSLPILLGTAGLASECFASAEAFLARCGPELAGCLLLDVRMEGMSGPELQRELARRGVGLPILFLSGHAVMPVGIQAMKEGAMDFLTKPVRGGELLERVQAALVLDRSRRQSEILRRGMAATLEKLTPRERQVLALALSGLPNKEIAARLGISLRTSEGHRSRIYLKTGVTSLLELVRQAADAGVPLAHIVQRPAGA